MTMPSSPNPKQARRLTRMQQLALDTWRWAAAKLTRDLDPAAIQSQAAMYVVLAALRDVDDPLVLFERHATAHAELALVSDVLPDDAQRARAYEILATAFLLRWNELVSDGNGPEEIPPLAPRGVVDHANTARD
jgi:hypothetical protein